MVSSFFFRFRVRAFLRVFVLGMEFLREIFVILKVIWKFSDGVYFFIRLSGEEIVLLRVFFLFKVYVS